VHLGKFPVVRKSLFCMRCNFKRQMSAANSQVEQAHTLKCCVVTVAEIKLASLKQTSFFKTPVVDKRII
jgi:hypothetical protein